jgi:hypothetical protein
MLTGLLPFAKGSYLKQIFSLPGCEALPNGRTLTPRGGELQSIPKMRT